MKRAISDSARLQPEIPNAFGPDYILSFDGVTGDDLNSRWRATTGGMCNANGGTAAPRTR
jgi:hypothetical protein